MFSLKHRPSRSTERWRVKALPFRGSNRTKIMTVLTGAARYLSRYEYVWWFVLFFLTYPLIRLCFLISTESRDLYNHISSSSHSPSHPPPPPVPIPPSTASYLSIPHMIVQNNLIPGGICLEDDGKIQMDDKVTGQQVASGFRSQCCCPGTRRQHNTSRYATRQIFGAGKSVLVSRWSRARFLERIPRAEWPSLNKADGLDCTS